MDLNLTRQDYTMIGVGAVLVLVVSFAAQAVQASAAVESYIDVIVSFVGIVTVYFMYKTAHAYGGDVGRYLAVMAVGVAYFTLTYGPHYYLHMLQLDQGIEQLAGVPLITVFGFHHIASVFSLGLAAYAFYLFWRGGQQ